MGLSGRNKRRNQNNLSGLFGTAGCGIPEISILSYGLGMDGYICYRQSRDQKCNL